MGSKGDHHLWWNIMGHADCPFSNCWRVRGSSFGTAYDVGLKEYLSSSILRLGSSSEKYMSGGANKTCSSRPIPG